MKTVFQTIALLLLALSFCFVSCTSKSGHLLDNKKQVSQQTTVIDMGVDSTVRVKVLENSTISYAIINKSVVNSFRPYDTVWLNMKTHRIDDTDTNTLKVVLCPDRFGTFYDGEGNEIPIEVVQLYVKSHFVHLNVDERTIVDQYFY
jgi:hypothetical protein